MLIYILKSAASMAIFIVFYKLLLERENMHVFKRFYLLLAIGASLTIPALVFTEYVVVEPVAPLEVQYTSPTQYDYIGVPPALENDILDIEPILWTVYFLGVIFFGLRFLKNLFQIARRVRKNPKQKSTNFIQVLLKENFPPHTFFKYIFLNKKKLEANEIPKEVLLHEETHARQKHSWDVVLIELLQVIFWFNPLVYLFKKAIKLNHEFLADQAVLNKDIDETTYKNTLLSYLSPDSEKKYQSQLANAINYSSIKKRFTVMKTYTSKKAVLLRSLLILPLIAFLLLAFTETKLIEISPEKLEEKASLEMITEYNKLVKSHNLFCDFGIRPRESEIRKVKHIYNLMTEVQKNKAEIFPKYPKRQDGASRELMKEYNALAKKYNTMLAESKRIQIKKQDVDRLEYIYELMSDKQKADAEPFPDFPEPPPPPRVLKGEISNIPPPEAPRAIRGEVSNIPPPKAPKTLKGKASDIPAPPAPPEPQSPIDHIIGMAKKGAAFYYEGKKISSDRAIELLKKNEELNIQSSGGNSKTPTVKISKEPIYLDRSAAPSSIETGNIEIKGKDGFYSKKDGITSYFNSNGEQIDKTGKVLHKKSENNPKFYFEDRQISSEKASRILSSNNSIQVTSKEYKDRSYAILLTDLNSPTIQNPNRNNNPNSVIDLTEMIEKDALFFYNDKPITTKKALWLTQNNLIERVNTIRPKKGKPKVYFWEKA